MNSTTDSYLIFLVKQLKIIILRCIHMNTQKHQIDAEQGKK